MTSKLSKHLKTNANEDSDEVFDTGGDDIVIEEEVEEQIDPRSRQRKNGEEQGSHWHIIRMTMQRLFSCIWPAAADFGDSAVYIR